jgi:hypothetical protein
VGGGVEAAAEGPVTGRREKVRRDPHQCEQHEIGLRQKGGHAFWSVYDECEGGNGLHEHRGPTTKPVRLEQVLERAAKPVAPTFTKSG